MNFWFTWKCKMEVLLMYLLQLTDLDALDVLYVLGHVCGIRYSRFLVLREGILLQQREEELQRTCRKQKLEIGRRQ